MNEWGLPNWRDEAAYGNTGVWGRHRWRWEFTRRREDYRRDYAMYESLKSLPLEEMVEAFAANGLSASPTDPYAPYGLSSFPDPRVSEQPAMSITFRSRAPATAFGRKSDGDGTATVEFSVDTSRTRALSLTVLAGNSFAEAYVWDEAGTIQQVGTFTKYGGVSVPEGFACVMLDMSKPLDRQWKRISGTLQRRQKMNVKDTRAHTRKWLTYLRVLDAREDGCSWDVIAKSGILGKAIATSTENNRRVKAASDAWDQARRIQFNFPN
jgi:hypothetical protein